MSGEKNNKSESSDEQPKEKFRCDEEQYNRLVKEGVEAWNEWRQKNLDKDILLQGAILEKANLQDADLRGANLQGADLRGANLQGANLRGANLQDASLTRAHLEHAWLNGAHLEHARLNGAHLEHAWLNDAHLESANLRGANLQGTRLGDAKLQGARLWDAKLQGARLRDANLQGADLHGANLQDADLEDANLQGAKLRGANLQGADLMEANLEKARFWQAKLQGANLMEANLEKARFWQAKLQGADFSRAIVDGETLLDEGCKVDRDTNFEAVAFGNMRIYPKTRQLLECNVRRMNWEEWYGKGHWWARFLKSVFIKPFWWMSDYGMSTARVVGTFFLLAFLFAAVYMNWAYWAPPGIVSNLIVQPEVGEAVLHYFGRALIRPVYFSIVTMTTLGFGDMYANKGSIAGHVILAVQVILGYVLLGALITRFAVLFTAGGPAGKFAESGKGPG